MTFTTLFKISDAFKAFRYFIIFLIACILFTSCKQKTTSVKFIKDEKLQKEFQEKFITVEDGGIIELPAGNYLISKSFSIEGKNNITIKVNSLPSWSSFTIAFPHNIPNLRLCYSAKIARRVKC